MKILWISKHQMTEEQKKPFGNADIEWYKEDLTSINDISRLIDTSDIIAVNLPISLIVMIHTYAKNKRIIVSKNKTKTKKGEFNFEKWQIIKSIIINKVDLLNDEDNLIIFNDTQINGEICNYYLNSNCKTEIDDSNLEKLIIWSLKEGNHTYLYKIIKEGQLSQPTKAKLVMHVAENLKYKLMINLISNYGFDFTIINSFPLAILLVKFTRMAMNNRNAADDYKKIVYLSKTINDFDLFKENIKKLTVEDEFDKCLYIIENIAKVNNIANVTCDGSDTSLK